jgi:hypothetical protein
MSGAELIGAISGIVAILDATIKLYSALRDASGLPSNIHIAAGRLPLVLETLQTARRGIKSNATASDDACVAMMLVLDSCEKKARSLQKIFRLLAPIPGSGTSTSRRVATALRSLSKGKKIDELMKGIMEDIQLLAGNHALSSHAKDQMRDLHVRVEQSSASSSVSSSITEQNSTRALITNFGKGPQNVHSGVGDQNINLSGSPQFNGTFTGPFSFATPAGTPRSVQTS